MIHCGRGRMEAVADLLMEAIRHGEMLGWHHSPPGTMEGDHYDRLVTQLRWQEMLIDGARARKERH